MPGLLLSTPGTRVSLISQRIRVEVPSDDDAVSTPVEIREIPLHDVEHIVLNESTHITIPALAECLRRNIPVILTAWNERVLGICIPPVPHNAARLAQYRFVNCPATRLRISSILVTAKILNSRRVLQRLAANRSQASLDAVLEKLESLARRCNEASSLEDLRGYEGAAAGDYFAAYGLLYPPHCPFPGRSRRPPLDPPNAILSYAYSLMAAEMECAIYSAGLDPSLGFFHETEDRRPSLALDLIEPFRAPLADAMALDLISHRILSEDQHFERIEDGVYLNAVGRKRFFVSYERRMNREFVSEQTGQRTSLREEFRNQALSLRRHLQDEGQFKAFLMN